MASLSSRTASIDLAALEALRRQGAREGRSLDFKRDFSFDSDRSKLEALADISSFANAVGGDLLLGVGEDTEERGLMGEIVGIEEDYDRTVLRIEESLRKGVNPRIPGIEFHRVPVAEGRFVLLIRVPRSVIGPHMVTFNDTYRIYGRAANSRPALSTQEIRDLVLANESIEERIRRFRIERVGRVVARDTPAPLKEGAAAIVHLMPYGSLTGEVAFSHADIERRTREHGLLPLGSGGQGRYPVFNGVAIASHYERSDAYAFVTNVGIAEGVNVDFTYPGETRYREPSSRKPCISDEWLLSQAVEFLASAQNVQLALGAGFPVQASIVLAGVKDHYLAPSSHPQEAKAITEDILNLGVVDILEPLEQEEWTNRLRPLFDKLAHAAGYWRSTIWNDEGRLTRPLQS